MANDISKTEKVWVHIFTVSGSEYFITSKINNREIYFIYQKTSDGMIKLGKSSSPRELEDKYTKDK